MKEEKTNNLTDDLEEPVLVEEVGLEKVENDEKNESEAADEKKTEGAEVKGVIESMEFEDGGSSNNNSNDSNGGNGGISEKSFEQAPVANPQKINSDGRHETRYYDTQMPERRVRQASPHVMDVCALVLGIISIISVFFWYITLPAGVLAIVFGAISARKLRSRIGKAGLILGIIGLAIFAFIYIGFILTIVMAQNY